MSAGISPIGTEILDGPSCSAALARTTLSDIARSNTLFGGRAAVWFGIRQLVNLPPTSGRLTSPLAPLPLAPLGAAPTGEGSQERDQHLTLLDIGAGAGDIAAYAARQARRLGVTLVPIALDRHRAAAALCRERGFGSLVADGHVPPLAERSVDIVVASQFLHHFSRDAAIGVLQALAPLARRGLVIADLRRAHAAALGIWLAGFALRFHPVTRRDGVTSVRRGFTARGLSELLLAAGLEAPVWRRPGYRLVSVWRAGDANR